MYQRILIPVDGSDSCALALAEAQKVATATSQFCLLYVAEDLFPFDAESMVMIDHSQLQAAIRETGNRVLAQHAEVLRQANCAVETILAETAELRVAEVITQQAIQWRAELIVMTTHGRTGLNRLLMGSVTEGVIRSAPVPVLLVRASR